MRSNRARSTAASPTRRRRRHSADALPLLRQQGPATAGLCFAGFRAPDQRPLFRCRRVRHVALEIRAGLERMRSFRPETMNVVRFAGSASITIHDDCAFGIGGIKGNGLIRQLGSTQQVYRVDSRYLTNTKIFIIKNPPTPSLFYFASLHAR